MSKTHVEIVDVTGTKWVGDGDDRSMTADERVQLGDLLSDFGGLSHLSLVVHGDTHYFNPIHVVSVAIKESE